MFHGFWYLDCAVSYIVNFGFQNKVGLAMEKEEEAKLRAKYPNLKSGGAHSSFLTKRLAKSVSYILVPEDLIGHVNVMRF